MKSAEIISIGDELLIGQVINTNASWMAEQLNLIGIPVVQATTIGDDALTIKKTIRESFERADIVLITGGLGPTKDDITKKTLSEFYEGGWKHENEV
jgi:nicotinamide-nucleotide amidase